MSSILQNINYIASYANKFHWKCKREHSTFITGIGENGMTVSFGMQAPGRPDQHIVLVCSHRRPGWGNETVKLNLPKGSIEYVAAKNVIKIARKLVVHETYVFTAEEFLDEFCGRNG